MKKVKKVALVGTLALAMMFGIIVPQIGGGNPTTTGNSQVQAGIIVPQITGSQVVNGVIIPQGSGLDFPPGPSKTTTLDFPPGPTRSIIGPEI